MKHINQLGHINIRSKLFYHIEALRRHLERTKLLLRVYIRQELLDMAKFESLPNPALLANPSQHHTLIGRLRAAEYLFFTVNDKILMGGLVEYRNLGLQGFY